MIQIFDFEQRLKKLRLWQKVCLGKSQEDKSCHDSESFRSPLQYLSSVASTSAQLEEISQQTIFEEFANTKNNKEEWTKFKELFETTGDDDTNAVKYMQSRLTFGYPLAFDGLHFKDFEDPYDDQEIQQRVI